VTVVKPASEPSVLMEANSCSVAPLEAPL